MSAENATIPTLLPINFPHSVRRPPLRPRKHVDLGDSPPESDYYEAIQDSNLVPCACLTYGGLDGAPHYVTQRVRRAHRKRDNENSNPGTANPFTSDDTPTLPFLFEEMTAENGEMEIEDEEMETEDEEMETEDEEMETEDSEDGNAISNQG
jgi:hypothetical protein